MDKANINFNYKTYPVSYVANVNCNKKFHFWAVSIKKIALPSIFIIFTICLVLFSSSNLAASKVGLKLWANNVVPSLLPFFIATNLLAHTNVITYVSKFCNKIMRPLFNVPGEAAYAFILGLISGYPVGGKIASDLRNSGLCSKDEGERMLCFTNNSGPLFILGTVRHNLICQFLYWVATFSYSHFVCINSWNCFGDVFQNKA